MALFTADAHFVVYMNAKDPKPSMELHSREALAPVFADLNKYAATMHFLGQTTILSLTGDRGTGETYCMPHHLYNRRRKAAVDGGRSPLYGHIREVGWPVAVCGAAALRRLAGESRVVMTISRLPESRIPREDRISTLSTDSVLQASKERGLAAPA